MKYVRNKQENRETEQVNLAELDRNQCDLEQFKTRDGKIDEALLEQAYVKFHYFNFAQLTKSNQVGIKDRFLDKVQHDHENKQKRMLVSRSQFSNLRSQVMCLPKKIVKEKTIFADMVTSKNFDTIANGVFSDVFVEQVI